MTQGQKRKHILYFEEETQSYFDIDLNIAQPKKSQEIISCIDSAKLIKHQIHLDNPSLLPPPHLIKDWLYAQCIEDGVFMPHKKYAIAYLKRDMPLNKTGIIFEIFACDNVVENKDIFLIPDIFLPMVLEKGGIEGFEALEFGLFLFGKNLVFYHQNCLVYHCFVRDLASFSNALHYVETLYSKQPFTLYTIGECGFEFNMPSRSLNELLGNVNHLLANLAFRYFNLSHELSLPLLTFKQSFSLYKSKSFVMLLKIAGLVVLTLAYPIGELLYSGYYERQTLRLSAKNLQLLQNISSYSKKIKNFNTTDIETIKTQNEIIKSRLYSLEQITASYIPRYSLIAKLAKKIINSGVRTQKFYFTSDLEQNSSSFEIELVSPSQKNIIHFLRDLQEMPLIFKDKEKIFNNLISHSKNNIQASAQIVWTYNAF